jgi:hypothetical protein
MEFARKSQIALAALSGVASTVSQRNRMSRLRRSDLFAINSFCFAITA